MVTLRCRSGSVHSRKLLGVRMEDTHLCNLRVVCLRVSFRACRRKDRS
jgi:hypothetical protein